MADSTDTRAREWTLRKVPSPTASGEYVQIAEGPRLDTLLESVVVVERDVYRAALLDEVIEALARRDEKARAAQSRLYPAAPWIERRFRGG